MPDETDAKLYQIYGKINRLSEEMGKIEDEIEEKEIQIDSLRKQIRVEREKARELVTKKGEHQF